MFGGVILKEVFLILFGFLLGRAPTWLDRKRRLKTHWSAIRSEVEQCKSKAGTLLKDNIRAPLYRLPLLSYQVSFPILLAEGTLDESEASEIGEFFDQVQDINRGLENATALYQSDKLDKLEKEHERNCLKAKRLVESTEENKSLYEKVKVIVDSKVTLPWWKY